MEIMREYPEIEASYSFADAYSFDAGQVEMTRLLSGRQAEAYFCGDDVLSIGALSAAQSAGLRVPQDLGLIGLNDMEMAGWQNIDLTTIRNPINAIVDASIELVAAMLDKPEIPPQARLFECDVVERGTLLRR